MNEKEYKKSLCKNIPTIKIDPMNYPAKGKDGKPRARLWFILKELGETKETIKHGYFLEQSVEKIELYEKNHSLVREFEEIYKFYRLKLKYKKPKEV